MANNEINTIHRITTWITPGLILIISYLLKTDIDYVKDQNLEGKTIIIMVMMMIEILVNYYIKL